MLCITCNLQRKCQALRTSILNQNNIPFHLEDKSPFNHKSVGPSIIQNNKMLSLRIHVGYEVGGIEEKKHNPLTQVM